MTMNGQGSIGDAGRIAEQGGKLGEATGFYERAGWLGDAGRVYEKMGDYTHAFNSYKQQGWHREALLAANKIEEVLILEDLEQLDPDSLRVLNDPRAQAMADAVIKLREQSYGDAGNLLRELGLNKLALFAYMTAHWDGEAARIAEQEGRLGEAMELYQQQGWYGEAGRVAEQIGAYRLAFRFYEKEGWNSDAERMLNRSLQHRIF